jgi:hypothetical protein
MLTRASDKYRPQKLPTTVQVRDRNSLRLKHVARVYGRECPHTVTGSMRFPFNNFRHFLLSFQNSFQAVSCTEMSPKRSGPRQSNRPKSCLLSQSDSSDLQARVSIPSPQSRCFCYVFTETRAGIIPLRLPHSEIPGSQRVYRSPRLIAVSHVLLRLHVPRHPPYAIHYFNHRLFKEPQCYAFFKEHYLII